MLRAAGFQFDIITAGVDESLRPGESPDTYVRRLAEAKAREVAEQHPDRPVLGADTVVVCGEAILGKPADAPDARRMLRMLSGRAHVVMTGVCLHHAGVCQGAVAETTVEFGALTEAEIDWYVASGEPSDKAGAYAIQGLASRLVTRIDGSYSNVVGLPVALVYGLCKQAGILIS